MNVQVLLLGQFWHGLIINPVIRPVNDFLHAWSLVVRWLQNSFGFFWRKDAGLANEGIPCRRQIIVHVQPTMEIFVVLQPVGHPFPLGLWQLRQPVGQPLDGLGIGIVAISRVTREKLIGPFPGKHCLVAVVLSQFG